MDLALKRMEDGSFDLDFESNDLQTSDDLCNAVALSIGTFARNRNLKNNQANLDPVVGGWWADALDEKGTLGGYLYEAFPGKLTPETIANVQDLVLEALKWMKDDGVAKNVSCSAEILENDILKISVEIEKPSGGVEGFAYELNWVATNGI